MNREDVIRARCEAATRGPWNAGRGDMATIVDGYESKWIYAGGNNKYLAVASGYEVTDWNEVMANARFIAHARTDVPDLLAEIARLRADLAAMTAERDAMRERAEENPMSDATNASHKEFIDASKALDSLGNVYLLTGAALERDIRTILTGAHKLKKAAALLDVLAHTLITVRAERDQLRAELDAVGAGVRRRECESAGNRRALWRGQR